MRPLLSCALAAAFAMTSPAIAQSAPAGSPLIDYGGYERLTREVRDHRATRLISMADFNALRDKSDVLLLDARSAQAFAEGHMKGAINLPLPDFTAEALAEVIGENKGRRILIYCNNNFTDNARPVVTKALPLALNIQTFINLYGYGYKNVYELGDALETADARVNWVASSAS